MKRYWLITLASLLLLGITAIAYARSSGSSITVTPSEMKNGETKTFNDDGRTITLRRDGDTIQVKVEGAGETKSLTITKEDGTITIDRDGIHRRTIVIGPDRFEAFHEMPHILPRAGRTQTWYVCPKDHATLRVPEGKESDTFKCPIDGTTMEKRKGHGFSFFIDDDSFEND
ncbi:MAG: hypothetical protein ACXVH7_12700, partial [Thermoanaerobaculia bacterium]